MSEPRTQMAGPAMPWKAFWLTWTAVAALLVTGWLGRIAARQFFDPDDIMRLVQVRDLLSGQGWFDLTQHRLNPPLGTPMHWSRLVDAPLALTIWVLTPLLGTDQAELAALVIVPMVTLACVMALAMRIAARFFDRDAAVFTAMSAALTPATLAQLTPLRIDHHGWQIACVMLAAASPLIVRSRNHAAALAGLAFAAALNISLETAPLAAGYGAILGWSWLRQPATDRRCAAYLVGLAAGLELLFLLTRGPWALAPWCDAIGPAHIGFALTVATGAAIATLWLSARRTLLLIAVAISGLAALAAFAATAPNCLAGPFSALDPTVRKYWFDAVSEGLPVWRQHGAIVLGTGLSVLAAAAGLVAIRLGASRSDRPFWNEYLALFVVALIAGTVTWRSIAFAGALGAVGLGWALSRAFTWARYDRVGARRGALPARHLMIAAVIAALAWLSLRPAGPDGGAQPIPRLTGSDRTCDSLQALATLDRLPPQVIMAPLDIAPTILATSRHKVVASSHHRANLAIRDVILAFLGDDRTAQQIVTAHHASLMVICSGVGEPRDYAQLAPAGLMARIERGQIPAWLRPIDIGQPATLKIFAVLPATRP